MGEPNMTNFYENLPDNSHKNRNEKKELPEGKRAEKVVHGKVKTKKNDMRKFTDIFIAEDAANVKNYILMDVIIPFLKNAVYDIIVGALDMSLYGRRGKSGGRPIGDRISYTDYNSVGRRDDRPYNRTQTASGYSYDDVILESRGEAESVLVRMDEMMETYGQVRVADMYDLVGITGEYTDNNYGWTNIRNAEVVRVRDGYKIKMPRALPLH